MNKIGDPDRKVASKAVYLARSLGEILLKTDK